MADVDSSFNEAHAVAEPGDNEGHVRRVGGQRGVVQLGGNSTGFEFSSK